MKVRAKFVVQSITRRKHWQKGEPDLIDVQMSPVTSGSDDDKAFWAATPGGEIKLSTCNHAAGSQFEPGASYYVEFTRAE